MAGLVVRVVMIDVDVFRLCDVVSPWSKFFLVSTLLLTWSSVHLHLNSTVMFRLVICWFVVTVIRHWEWE